MSCDMLNWKVKDCNDRVALALKQRHGFSSVVAHLLASRGVSIESISSFIKPTLRDSMPNPNHLLDMDKAVNRICEAIAKNESIMIYGDYDVDGATSTALLVLYLRFLGASVSFYIPDRIREGYGPNSSAMQTIKDDGFDLCITVDCGTVACEPINFARDIGLDVIIVDHHIGGLSNPDCVALVNPNRLDQLESNCRNLAAVGVVFLLLVATNSSLRVLGVKNTPNLLRYLDLVALGTVCDVVKLTGLNRSFVFQGLKIMSMRKNIGLSVLSDLLDVGEAINTYHLGFIIGPNINAGGRVGKSSLGAEILSAQDKNRAHEISRDLIAFNNERKAIEKNTLYEALELINKDEISQEKSGFLMPCGRNWHQGVIGIVASRIKDRFNTPVAVVSINNGIGKASARSVQGIDFGSAVLEAKSKGLILEGGGHAMAAGFSVAEDMIDELHDFFVNKFRSHKSSDLIEVDLVITLRGLDSQLCRDIQILAPFGPGNNEPKFALRDFKITSVKIINEQHVACLLYDGSCRVNAICFRCVGTPIGDKLLKDMKRIVVLIGKAKLLSWKGSERVQFVIESIGE